MKSTSWFILKFGGSSVADPAHWPVITDIVKSKLKAGYRPLLVLSALKNVSNALEALLHQASAGVFPMALTQLQELHLGFASKLGLSLESSLEPYFTQLQNYCEAIALSGKVTPQDHAKVLAIGELLSTTIGAAYLTQQGLEALLLDARSCLKTLEKNDGSDDNWHHFTSASCEYTPDIELQKQLAEKSQETSQQVLVTQGFIASDTQGETVLLGREGSDTSAAYFAAKLLAAGIEIWTDVPGVFSANPRDIPQARQLKTMSYAQAQQLASLGAKVLHPRAIAPAKAANIPLKVKSTLLPQHSGSEITQAKTSTFKQPPVIALATGSPISLLKLSEDLTDEIRSNIINSVLACGFDPIGEFRQKDYFVALSYSNSDKPQPNDKELLASWAKGASIHSGQAIISLIGQVNRPAWMAQVEEIFCNKVINNTLIFKQENIGQVSLIVCESQALLLARLLHKELIETAERGDMFAENWQSLSSQ